MIISKIQSFLFKFESVKWVKNRVRPIKHWLVGKDGIYKVMDEVAALHGGANNVATIFDVGAATGEYTLHFLKHFPRAFQIKL
jgi:hypothetical protein